jgi:succinate dehydrogenase / fumarate reductase flavoprotein subunit
MTQREPFHLETDVLVIGSGGAGMYAAIEAARAGHRVVLADRSLIGRSGGTVMAMMTVAVALGAEGQDDPSCHLTDTLASGRGLCDERLSRLMCEEGPECILEMDRWGVGWARKDGAIHAAHAPGHDRPRCVYVDFLNTGPAVSKTLRKVLHDHDAVRRVGDLLIVDLVVSEGAVTGAVALEISTGRVVTIATPVTIIATGGLTRLFRRSSASFNMGGDGYALGLRAGARLIDMEFVQFFPIGHLAPRLIGLDPIMWDPFRYKLGGRLLNADMEEFTGRYGTSEDGRYVITRDAATYAITKEVEAGRGTPHGGAYLSFMHLGEEALRAAFGPVIDKLAANGIDLTRIPVEVAPIAHYHMGGIAVDARMETGVPGLLAAGEAVGGANGANRLSGNAITEALVFGRRAGRTAAERLAGASDHPPFRKADAAAAVDLVRVQGGDGDGKNTAAMVSELQAAMSDHAGPFKTAESLASALAVIDDLEARMGEAPPGATEAFAPSRVDWFDLRNMTLVARTVIEAASRRTESRGAHQREDFPGMLDDWTLNQFVALENGRPVITTGPLRSDLEATA